MIDELLNFSIIEKVLKNLVPDGTVKDIELDNMKYSISNKDGDITINVSEKFNDELTRERVKEFKESLKLLDDCFFLEVTEEFNKSFDNKEFDNLLKLDNYSEKESDRVNLLIDKFSDIICDNLHNKIENLVNLYARF